MSEHGSTSGTLWSFGGGGLFLILALVAWANLDGIFGVVATAWFGLLGLAGVAFGVRERGSTIRVHERGLLLAERGRETAIRWDEATSLTIDLVRRSGMLYHQYRLEGPTGRIRFGTGYSDVGTLGREVERRVMEHLVPRARRQLADGDPVTCGPFTLTREELRCDDRSVRWAEVLEAAFEEGRFVVRLRASDDPWAEVPVSKIPNSPLLLDLVTLSLEERDAASGG